MRSLFALLWILPVSLFAADAELSGLLTEGRKELETCKKVTQEMDKLLLTDKTAEKFKDKAAAIRALEKLESTPSTLATRNRLLERVTKKGDAATDEDFSAVFELGKCDVELPYFRAMKLLLQQAKTKDFSAAEKARVRTVVLRHLEARTHLPAQLLGVLFELDLANRMLDNQLLEAGNKTKQGLASLKKQAQKVQMKGIYSQEFELGNLYDVKSFRDLNARQKKHFTKAIRADLRRSEPIRLKLVGLVAQLPKPKPESAAKAVR